MSENLFQRMALNNAWANSTLYGAVRQFDTDAIWADRSGFFRSIGRTLNHIYEVDLYYVDALTQGGKGRSVFQRDDLREVSDLGAAQGSVDMAFASFCGSLSPEDHGAMRQTERKDEIAEERVDHLILHLVQHQIHHRGQVHTMLSDAGLDPPQLDDFYLKFGRAGTAEPYWT